MRKPKVRFSFRDGVIVYVIGISLTFGYITHHDRWLCTYGTIARSGEPDFVGGCAVGNSAVWPAYWTFRLGYLLFGKTN